MKLKKINKKWLFIILLCVALIPTNALAANSFSNGKTISMCGWDNMPEIMPKLTSALYAILKLIVPVILIILGMIDFLNATMSPDVDKMKKHQKKFINRLIAAVFIFFVAAIVQMVFRKLDTPDKNTFFTCMDCILSNKNCATSGGTSGGTSCESRGISTCTSTVDKNGYKCELVQTSYSSQACKRACSEYLAASTCTGQNGRCKWSGSISSGSCSKNPDYTPNNSMNKKTGGGGGSNGTETSGDNNGNTSGTPAGTGTDTNTSYQKKKCSDCAKISDTKAKEACNKNCVDDSAVTDTSNTSYQKKKCSDCAKISDTKAKEACNKNCVNDGGGGSSGGTITTNTTSTSKTQVSCIGLPKYECDDHSDVCSWSNLINGCGYKSSGSSTNINSITPDALLNKSAYCAKYNINGDTTTRTLKCAGDPLCAYDALGKTCKAKTS